MSIWRDFAAWWNATETRSDEPGPSDPSTALTIPTRGDWQYGVSSGEAVGLIPVYRAVQIISTSVMQLSLDSYQAGQRIEEKPLLLRRPDPNETLSATLEKLTLSLALNGNFFIRVFRDSQGRTTGLRVLNPRDVEIKVDRDGNVLGYTSGDREFTPTEIRHGALLREPGTPRGRGPIQHAQADLRGALDVQAFAANWFRESVVPVGVLKTDQDLNAEQAEMMREQWEKSQGGKRGTAVLGKGLGYESVYLNPAEAQWIEARRLTKTDVATLFGIPAALMLASIEGSAQTYSNISQAWTEFQRFTLSRYTVEIEAALSDLLPRGTEARFNLEALLRPDALTRSQLHTAALSAGWLSVNEVRAIEGLDPVPGGDFPTQAELDAQAAQFEPTPDSDEPPVEEEAPDA